jgi:hypothetical protein
MRKRIASKKRINRSLAVAMRSPFELPAEREARVSEAGADASAGAAGRQRYVAAVEEASSLGVTVARTQQHLWRRCALNCGNVSSVTSSPWSFSMGCQQSSSAASA